MGVGLENARVEKLTNRITHIVAGSVSAQ